MNKTFFRTKRWTITWLVLLISLLTARLAPACTIFVLTDADHSLFFNNEDWKETKTAIWFVPAGEEYLGCAYVGFTDGKAQGGVNTAGLAYDVVAGRPGEMREDPSLPRVRGNPLQRMLETCRTVDDAIGFFHTHRIGFSGAQVLIADSSGMSAILTPDKGELLVDKSTSCRALGYGQQTIEQMLQRPVQPTIKNGAKMLEAAVQSGKFGTKYSSVYDLKTGDIFIYQFQQFIGPVKLSLPEELKKEAHFYNMASIHRELTAPMRPLSPRMWRFPLDFLTPISDAEPKVTAHVRVMLVDDANGARKRNDYSDDAWKLRSRTQAAAQAFYQSLGRLDALVLLERTIEGDNVSYRFRLTFNQAKVLYHIVLNNRNQCILDEVEDIDYQLSRPIHASSPGLELNLARVIGGPTHD